MLQSDVKETLAVAGIDQQDFDAIQLVSGAFPSLTGLQQRIPGKTLDRVYPSPVGSIYVFYNVYGRPFRSVDFQDGTIEIEETPLPVWRIPALSPVATSWFDDFFGYTLGTVARLWGAGIWDGGIGVCETIIEGLIDPFLVYATITGENPIPVYTPTVVTESAGTPLGIVTGGAFDFPFGIPDIVLIETSAVADNSCTGQGTQPFNVDDSINLYTTPGVPQGAVLHAYDLVLGQKVTWYGLSVGRASNIIIPGYVQGTCIIGLPPQPVAIVYYYNLNNGEFGVES
jgi:hypothetical protein